MTQRFGDGRGAIHESKRRTRRPPWWVLALAVVLAVEVGVRLFLIGYRRWMVENRLSSDAAAEMTVLCLGDSVTFGNGADPSQSYPRHLERLLSARWPERRISIVSTAWPGFNSSQLLERLPDYLDTVRPDIVLVLIGSNDRWNFRGLKLAVLEAVESSWSQRQLILLDQWLAHVAIYRLTKVTLAQHGQAFFPVAPNDGNHSSLEATEPDDPEAQAALARSYLQNLEFERARPLLERLIRHDPANPAHHVGLGYVHVFQGRFEEAGASAQAALALEPAGAKAFCLLGDAARLQNRWEQSHAMFSKAVELDPSDAETWLGLAEVSRRLGRLELAQRAFQTTFRLHPQMRALVGLVQTYEDPREGRRVVRGLIEELRSASEGPDATREQMFEVLAKAGFQRLLQNLLEFNLEEMVELASGRTIPMAVVTYPNFASESWMNLAIRQVAARRPDLILIDAAELLSDRLADPSQDLMSPDGWHPNAAGYQLLARQIMDALVSAGMLGTAPLDATGSGESRG